jgi:hypothetical protein
MKAITRCFLSGVEKRAKVLAGRCFRKARRCYFS